MRQSWNAIARLAEMFEFNAIWLKGLDEIHFDIASNENDEKYR